LIIKFIPIEVIKPRVRFKSSIRPTDSLFRNQIEKLFNEFSSFSVFEKIGKLQIFLDNFLIDLERITGIFSERNSSTHEFIETHTY
jgi:hypothetical protein